MDKIKIGIVEDQAIIALDLQSKLGMLGYIAFDTCDSYSSAIEMLISKRPDIVILDINLHGKNDGIRIGKFIRTKLNMPFIYLTAYSDSHTVAAAKETMPDAYLIKPFNKESLFSTIEVALHNFNKARHKETEP